MLFRSEDSLVVNFNDGYILASQKESLGDLFWSIRPDIRKQMCKDYGAGIFVPDNASIIPKMSLENPLLAKAMARSNKVFSCIEH